MARYEALYGQRVTVNPLLSRQDPAYVRSATERVLKEMGDIEESAGPVPVEVEQMSDLPRDPVEAIYGSDRNVASIQKKIVIKPKGGRPRKTVEQLKEENPMMSDEDILKLAERMKK